MKIKSASGVKVLLTMLVLSVVSPAFAAAPADSQPLIAKRIVIIKSTHDYTQAKSTALQASKKLGLKLKLRNLTPHKKTGLTYPAKTCNNDGFEYPCYIARGRYDDGAYISIEHSNAFEGFAKGYYIVVIASAADKNPIIKNVLKKAKKHYKDAYAKLSRIYIGCIH